MKLLRFAAFISATFSFGSYAYGQDTPVNVKTLMADTSNVKSRVSIPFLNNASITLYGVDDDYFFTPNPLAEWATFNDRVQSSCSGQGGESVNRVPLDILMYDDSIIPALAKGAGVGASQIGPIPSYAYSIFYRIGDDPAVLIETTLNAKTLLANESLTSLREIPKSYNVLVKDTCDRLQEIGQYARILVIFHVLGNSFTSNSFSAEVTLRDSVKLALNANQDAKEIDELKITSASSSSGFGLSIGPIDFSNASSGGDTTRKVTRYRSIDSDWSQGVVDNAMATINISQVCSGGRCDVGNVSNLLMTFLNQYITTSTARINKMADDSMKLSVDNIPGEIKISVSEELKAKLETLLQNSNGQEVEYDGVKAKKTDDNTLQVDDGTEWKRDGDEWIPTSFNIRLVNETALQQQLDLKYSQVILEGSEAVSVTGGQQEVFRRDQPMGVLPLTYVQSANDLSKRTEDLSKKADALSARIEGNSVTDLLPQIQAQAICTAIAYRDRPGWSTAVPRTCSASYPSCAEICADLKNRSDDAQVDSSPQRHTYGALHIYSGNPATSQAGITGLKTFIYPAGEFGRRFCGPNFCCCKSDHP